MNFRLFLLMICLTTTAFAKLPPLPSTHELLRSLPAAPSDAKEEGRDQRLSVLADGIDLAAARATCQGYFDRERCEPHWFENPNLLRAYLVTLGWWESKFSKRVHERRCRSYECDAWRILNSQGELVRIIHRSRSPWQFQRWGYVAKDWDAYQGADPKSTRHAAWAAAKVISRAHRACRSHAGAFTYYATGGRCSSRHFDQAHRRAAWMLRLFFDRD
jgi:hypothetical protein